MFLYTILLSISSKLEDFHGNKGEESLSQAKVYNESTSHAKAQHSSHTRHQLSVQSFQGPAWIVVYARP